MKIAIDFDGTIVEHRFPEIGRPVPHAFNYMKQFQAAGAKLILFTMRSGDTLTEAVEFCRRHGVEFFGVNRDPDQDAWTSSPKAYAERYIDDAAVGCPLDWPQRGRPYVDWEVVGPAILCEIANRKAA